MWYLLTLVLLWTLAAWGRELKDGAAGLSEWLKTITSNDFDGNRNPQIGRELKHVEGEHVEKDHV